jgi:hypothetical protein
MTASNTIVNPTIIAKEALALLENNLVLGGLVHRGYEDEFDKTTNGYKCGSSVTIKKPARYTVRSGATASIQDSVEGTTTITVDVQEGVDFQFNSTDMTMKVGQFSDRYLKSAMIQLANSVDSKIAALYKDVWNWVGTPGQVINSFTDFALGPQRLDEMAVPQGDRFAALSPADNWGLLGSFTGLYIQDTASSALKKAKLPMIGNVDPYMTQNVQVHTTGTRDDTTPTVNGNQSTTYAASKDTGTMSLLCQAFDATSTLTKGDVFTIAECYAVNPVTKAVQSYLQQFVVKAAATASGGAVTLTISPPIITSGAYQTVSLLNGTTASKAIVNVGAASTGYNQNLIAHKNAFSLVVVPMEIPSGAVNVQRVSQNGLSVRMIPYYDGTNDIDNWRLDILYKATTIYPDLATRISGT